MANYIEHGQGDFHNLDSSSGVKLPSDPELDNFLSQVDDISEVIKALASTDASENERGLRKAEILLRDHKDNSALKIVDEENVECKVKANRTIINKVKENEGQGETQAWMRMMEKDSEERARDRKERKTKSDVFRKQGNIAFSKKDFATAIRNYNEAINLIKDSPCLYNNRALTYIRLGIFSSAIEDCEKALRLEEYSMRARMFMAKSYFMMGEAEKCRQTLQEARIKLPGSLEIINDYQKNLFNLGTEKKLFDFDLDSEKQWQAAARYEGTDFPVGESSSQKKKSNKNEIIGQGDQESEEGEN